MITKYPNLSIFLCILWGLGCGILIGTSIPDSNDSKLSNTASIQKRDHRPHNSGHRIIKPTHDNSSFAKSRYAQIRRLPGSNTRITTLAHYYKSLTTEQLQKEALLLEGLPNDDERDISTELLFTRWGELDPQAAIEYKNGWPQSGRWFALKSWASIDPEAAAAYCVANSERFNDNPDKSENSDKSENPYCVDIIIREWAKKDLDRALEWANQLSGSKKMALSIVIGELAVQDPLKAISMLDGVDLSSKNEYYRVYLIKAIALSYGSKHFNDACNWVQTLPADEQAAAMYAVFTGSARLDLSAALENAATMQSGHLKDRAVDGVIDTFFRNDPKKAADFLLQNASASTQEKKIKRLIETWVFNDANEALDYSSRLPAGPVRDSALTSYIFIDETVESSKSLRVAETISSETTRRSTVGRLVSRWMFQDKEAALNFIDASPDISDKDKAYYHNDFEKNRWRLE